MENDILRFGSKASSKEYLDMAYNGEINPPKLEQFDAWGKRIDKLHTSEGWKFFKKEAAIEKLIQLPYKHTDVNDSEYNSNARL
jgi:putative acyl-CoA dehydrogenase